MSATIFGAHTLDEVPGNLSISMAIPCMNPTVAPTHLLILFQVAVNYLLHFPFQMGSSSGTGKKAQQGMYYLYDFYPQNEIISVQHRQKHLKQRQKAKPGLYCSRYFRNIISLAIES